MTNVCKWPYLGVNDWFLRKSLLILVEWSIWVNKCFLIPYVGCSVLLGPRLFFSSKKLLLKNWPLPLSPSCVTGNLLWKRQLSRHSWEIGQISALQCIVGRQPAEKLVLQACHLFSVLCMDILAIHSLVIVRCASIFIWCCQSIFSDIPLAHL